MRNRAGWMTGMTMMVGTLTSVPAIAAEAAAAVTAPTPRRIVVSIPDRRMLVVENNEVLAAFAVAVGAPATPSSVGTFTMISLVTKPTLAPAGSG